MPACSNTLPTPERHSLFDDAQGLTSGVFLCAVGLAFLSQLGFLTGQTAGLALMISYLTGVPFGAVFFLVNIPFYWVTYKQLGRGFAIKSAFCVALMSVLAGYVGNAIQFSTLNPLVGVLAFGAITGVGLLIIIRHKGSLGGMGALAMMIQDKTGFRAGYVQQIADALIFITALFFFPVSIVAWSVFGSIILNAIIAVNHRRDRYIAT